MVSLVLAILDPAATFLLLTVAVLCLVAIAILQLQVVQMRFEAPSEASLKARAVVALLLGAVYVATFSAEDILVALPAPAAALDSLFWTVFGAVLLTTRPLGWWLLRLP